MASDGKGDGSGHQVLRYLDEHRVLFGRDRSFREAVDEATEGGVRVTPNQVRRLSPSQTGAGQAIKDLAPELDGLTLRVLDIAGDAANATGELNRDLVTAMAEMLDPQATDVRPIVTKVIDMAAGAEAGLREAVRQARHLRDDLNALHDHASRDRLTGLFNRAAIKQRLVTAAASPAGCSVAMVDVDRSRAVNDGYGHSVGDRVLRAVAATLREACSAHPVARWGGDVFLVLFEAAREALSARRMKLREDDRPLDFVSFSAGVVSSRSREPAAIVEAAEALVREAKERGRNTIMTERAAVGL